MDFFGRFTLPYPISYEIDFLGEAKRVVAPIAPDQVSRLVARLGRGQYGLYFPTSFYSELAQREIFADRYPVRLFSGQDIVNMLRIGNCIFRRFSQVDWKTIAISRPSETLSSGLRTSVI